MEEPMEELLFAWLPHGEQRPGNPQRWNAIKGILSQDVTGMDSFAKMMAELLPYTHEYMSDGVRALNRLGQWAPRTVDMDAMVKAGVSGAAKMLLRAPVVFGEGSFPGLPHGALPLLPASKEDVLVLTREQVACVVAAQFFCVLDEYDRCVLSPKGEIMKMRRENRVQYPECSFRDFFPLLGPFGPSQLGRFLCVLEYFRRCGEETPKGSMTIHRRCVQRGGVPKWGDSTQSLCKILASDTGKIEERVGGIHADFANEYIGGGALQGGNVQEEIRFVLSPELIVSMVVCERMANSDAIVMKGTEMFSASTGYGGRFAFESSFQDPCDRLGDGTPHTCVVEKTAGMDAVFFRGENQFSLQYICRELRKVWAAIGWEEKPPRPFITGHWGCGMFNGNKQLKALIQILAASEAGRDVEYMCFGDKSVAGLLEELEKKKDQWTVGTLFNFMVEYGEKGGRRGVLEALVGKKEE